MTEPLEVQAVLESVFTRILQEQMQGIPILNPAIRVEALGFRHHEGRVLGILITPWLMNVVMLPAAEEDWSEMSLGQKQPHAFPSGTYKFMANEIDGIGMCQTHSLHSPMRAFGSHEHAVKAAREFLDKLMQERDPGAAEPVDEELLGKVMRGEVVPETHFEDFASLNAEEVPEEEYEPEQFEERSGAISRRTLLKGRIRRTA
mgnify:FL=1